MPKNNQLHTKHGKPMIHRQTGLPIYCNTVEYRIKTIKQQLGQGLSKFENAWNSIINDPKLKPIQY